MHSVNVEIEVDLPDGVTVRGYERHRGAHVFEIDFELPERSACSKCRREAETNVRWKNEVLPVRDLDLFGQPTFWVYQPPLHQCPHCRQRTQIPAPFKRPRAAYTYRFEEWALELLVGLSVQEVARRLSVSAEMVEGILDHRLKSERAIPPDAEVTSIGMVELSLKKRQKSYDRDERLVRLGASARAGGGEGPRSGGGRGMPGVALAATARSGAFAPHRA